MKSGIEESEKEGEIEISGIIEKASGISESGIK